jgi:hypothetical protein
MACGSQWNDPGAPEHVISMDSGFRAFTGKNTTAAAFAAIRALENGGFKVTRYPVDLPDCPMNFSPDRCSGCRAVRDGLPHSHVRMQGDPTVSASLES